MMNKGTIYLDMDGTFVNLYGVENWLPMLRAKDTTPYKVAKPLVNLSLLARRLNQLQNRGYGIGIISWTAKDSNLLYDMEVESVKRAWLKKHMPSVKFDEINIVPYGTPKNWFGNALDVLFDDEEHNRDTWIGTAYDVENILGILKNMLDN